MDELNRVRLDRGQPPLTFGIALHLGDVMYGNIGAPGRLDFTVIGPAANEAARLEAMCKTLETSPVVSEAFARRHGLTARVSIAAQAMTTDTPSALTPPPP